jgi:hypothetical protein
MKEFLKNFLQFGLDKGYFRVVAVKDIPKVCCPASDIEAIDFDATKEIYCQETKTQSLKSCDALKIIPYQQRIDFIEFKGLKNFIARNPKAAKEDVEEKIEELNLQGKIIDSNHLLYGLLNKRVGTTKSERNYYHQVTKNYLVVVDIDPEKEGIESIAVTLDFLSEASSPMEKIITNKLSETILSFPSSELLNIKQPLLKSCKSFDAFYQEQGIC